MTFMHGTQDSLRGAKVALEHTRILMVPSWRVAPRCVDLVGCYGLRSLKCMEQYSQVFFVPGLLPGHSHCFDNFFPSEARLKLPGPALVAVAETRGVRASGLTYGMPPLVDEMGNSHGAFGVLVAIFRGIALLGMPVRQLSPKRRSFLAIQGAHIVWIVQISTAAPRMSQFRASWANVLSPPAWLKPTIIYQRMVHDAARLDSTTARKGSLSVPAMLRPLVRWEFCR